MRVALGACAVPGEPRGLTMFGLLRPPARDGGYRQLYAGCCAFQHQQCGIASLPLLSYEAVFLYVLGADAGACAGPDSRAATCCRLRRRGARIHPVDPTLAAFCCSFGLLLASIKLEDDVRDDRSWLANLALWHLKSPLLRARRYFRNLAADFDDRVQSYIERHLHLENSDSRLTLDEYARPTSEAFAFLFELYERVLPERTMDGKWLHELGSQVGRAILAFDCAVDWLRDRWLGRFNPLPDAEAVQDAYLASQRALSHVGEQCRAAFGPASLAARVAAATSQRIQRRSCRARSGARPQRKRFRWPGGVLRRGVCDCACDCPADGACCDGCAGCGNGDCCHTGDALDVGCSMCDCFGRFHSTSERSQRKADQGEQVGPSAVTRKRQ